MQTIAFFIRNTSFYPNYIKPYADLLKDQGYRIVILHSNSITEEFSKTEFDEPEIEQIDIIKDSLKTTIEKIKELNISAIVSINFHSPLDFLVNRICKFMKIKSVYMEHGILAENPGKYIVPPNKLKSLKRFIIYLIKFLSFSMLSGHFVKELYIFLRKQFILSPYDNYLLYSPASLKKLNSIYEIEDKQVRFSGYPLNQNENEIEQTYYSPYILYIHQPHVLHKISNCSYDDEFNLLNEISSIIQKVGYNLIIKLHPLESIERYTNGLKNTSIILDNNNSINHLIINSEAVLGHYSTALFMAVKNKKPIIQFAIDCFKKNEHFLLFENISLQLLNIENINKILSKKEILCSKIEKYQNFIDEYIGYPNTYEDRVKKLLLFI